MALILIFPMTSIRVNATFKNSGRALFRLAARSMLLALLLVVSPCTWSAGAGQSAQLLDQLPEELALRETLFDAHQGNYLSALIRFPENPEDPEARLLKAQTLAEFGLLDRSREILQTLVRDNGGKISAEAAFELGRIEYKAGRYPEATDAFKRINGLDKRLLPIYRRYNAAALLAQNDLTGAAKILSKIEESVWAGYAYENLAYKYFVKDSDPSRALISLRVAEALTGNDQVTVVRDEKKELNSKIYLAAGQLSIDSLDYEKAITFLNKVSVDSASAAQSLYLHGLAHAKSGRFRQAIQSWYRVKKYPLIEEGVADAFMGLAYAFDKEGYVSKSIRSYLEAISVLEKEVRTMDTVIHTIDKIGAVSALLRESSLDKLEWFLADNIATNTPKVSYLIYLVSDSALQKQVERIAEIDVIIDNLSIWQHDLAVFNKMLASRVSGFHQGAKDAQAKSSSNKLEKLKRKRDDLLTELSRAEADNNFVAVATDELQSQFEQASLLNAQYSALIRRGSIPAADEDTLSERMRVVSGVLLWDAKEQYDANIQTLRRDFSDLDKEIARYETNLKNFGRVISGGPQEFDVLLAKTIEKKKLNETALARAKQLLADADAELTASSLALLSTKREQINNRYEEAQQGLAHLYERLAMSQYEHAETQRKIEEEKRISEEKARNKLKGITGSTSTAEVLK